MWENGPREKRYENRIQRFSMTSVLAGSSGVTHLILHFEMIHNDQRFAARHENLGLPGSALLRREDAPCGWGPL